jgi:hypothetical protein
LDFGMPGFDRPVDKGLNVGYWNVRELRQLAQGAWETIANVVDSFY